MQANITSKGPVTIPRELRQHFKLRPGMAFEIDGDPRTSQKRVFAGDGLRGRSDDQHGKPMFGPRASAIVLPSAQ